MLSLGEELPGFASERVSLHVRKGMIEVRGGAAYRTLRRQ
jgi:hypothetical protein